MADESPKFGLSVGPFSVDTSLSAFGNALKDAAGRELQRRFMGLANLDQALKPSVQALQGIELRTPLGNVRPFVPPGQEPIPPDAPLPAPPAAPQKRFVQGETQYTPPPTHSADQPVAPPVAREARTVPSPTSGGTPRVVDPGLLYQAIGSEAYERPPDFQETTVVPPDEFQGPMPPPPGSKDIGGRPPKVDWRALVAALQPIARGLREPSTDRPYARMGYFQQLEQEQNREQQMKLSQMGADAAMARQEAENRARAQMEREQLDAALERERVQQEAAMERAKLEAQSRRELQADKVYSQQEAAALGHPEWAGLTASQVQAASYASAAKEAQSDRDLQRSQMAQSNLQARIAQLDAQLQNPMMLANPEERQKLMQQREVYQAQLDALQTKYFPEMAQAAQAQRAAQLRQSVMSQFAGYKLSEATQQAIAGILSQTAPGSVDRARALQELANKAPQDERIQLHKFLADQAKAPAGK